MRIENGYSQCLAYMVVNPLDVFNTPPEKMDEPYIPKRYYNAVLLSVTDSDVSNNFEEVKRLWMLLARTRSPYANNDKDYIILEGKLNYIYADNTEQLKTILSRTFDCYLPLNMTTYIEYEDYKPCFGYLDMRVIIRTPNLADIKGRM